jgi:hypothetical protein
MPSTFPRSERSRRSQVSANNNSTYNRDFEDGPRSNLDSVRYTECVNYLQDVITTLPYLQIIGSQMLSLSSSLLKKKIIKLYSYASVSRMCIIHFRAFIYNLSVFLWFILFLKQK